MSFSRVALVLSLALFTLGCNQQNSSQATRYHDDGRLKPIVAFVPVFDHSDNDLSWDVSEELSQTIYHRLTQKNRLYLVAPEDMRVLTHKLTNQQNPFGSDLGWMRKAFANQEFVVFLELVEHEEVPVQSSRSAAPEELSANLNMSVRIRVVDVRGAEPHVVLQELIHDTHSIPRQFTKENFYQVPWGK